MAKSPVDAIVSAQVDQAGAVDDTDVFVLHEHVISLVDGGTYTCPRSNYGKELKLIELLKDVLGKVLDSGILKPDHNAGAEELTSLTNIFMETGPAKLTAACEVLTGKPTDWIMEQMTIESVIGVVVPFLQSKRELIMNVLKPYFGQLTETGDGASGPTVAPAPLRIV